MRLKERRTSASMICVSATMKWTVPPILRKGPLGCPRSSRLPGARSRRGDTPLLALEGLFDGVHDTGIPALIARQQRDGFSEGLTTQNRQHALHRFEFQELLAADEEIILGDQPHEIELELSRRGL